MFRKAAKIALRIAIALALHSAPVYGHAFNLFQLRGVRQMTLTDAMMGNLRRTYGGFILMGYSHNAASYHAALHWGVQYDLVRDLLRPSY